MPRKRKQLWVIPVFIAAVLVATGGWFAWNAGGQREAVPASGKGEAEDNKADVTWNGKEYNYNDHLSNFLFLGIDNREKEATTTGQANAGQADAIYLAAWDRVEKTATLISIPRDTMTQIEAFGPGGESLGKTEDHISLSYAYGDGGYESCRLAKEAVSQLFYGLPIQGYCSINLDGIPVLTESVGTVTVSVPNDSLEAVDPQYREGAQVTLTPDMTETFVRYRDTGISQSAISRMERQQEYIRAFGEAAKKKIASDSEFGVDLYTAMEPYMVTNIGTDQFLDLIESLASGKTGENWTVPGEGTSGEMYDEYHVDDEGLYEKIIETFYEEAE